MSDEPNQEVIQAAVNLTTFYEIDLKEHSVDFMMKVLSSIYLSGEMDGIGRAKQIIDSIETSNGS